MLDAAQYASQPVPGRACGSCTLCCKVFDIAEIQKPAGKWCRHCTPGRGCGVYETRPEQCRAFHCVWMTTDFLGPEWKPERCAFVRSVDPATQNLLVQVDPGRPTAWKAEPYQSQLRRWAEAGLAQGRHVIVFINHNGTVVLPDKDIGIGPVKPGDRLSISRQMTAHGMVVDVRKVSGGEAVGG
jgi:hypothetical protein